MNRGEFLGMSPRSFGNKMEGFYRNRQEDWQIARFIAMTAGNSQFYKKPLKHKDMLFDFEKSEVSIPTEKDHKWMDDKFGRKL